MTTVADNIAFKITRKTDGTPAAERESLVANPGFGRAFTDHMAVVTYTEGRGWHSAEILPASRSCSTPPPPCCTTRRKFLKA